MAAWYHNHTLIYKMIFLFKSIINNAVISTFVYKSLSTFLIIPTEKSLTAEILYQSLNNLKSLIVSVKLAFREVVPIYTPTDRRLGAYFIIASVSLRIIIEFCWSGRNKEHHTDVLVLIWLLLNFNIFLYNYWQFVFPF